MPIAATQVWFKREKNQKWEDGIAIIKSPNISDIITLVDSNGNIVPPDDIWNYRLLPHYGAFAVQEISPQVAAY